jgi:hypothetical protein
MYVNVVVIVNNIYIKNLKIIYYNKISLSYMAQETNNTLFLENNNLRLEIDILHKMSKEKDNLLININSKLLNMEDQMNRLIEQNNHMESEMSRLMTYLVSFASEVKDELRHIKHI